MKASIETKNPNAYSLQQRIVDVAHMVDPEGGFAESLAALADDDPARGLSRQKLRERVDLLQLKKEIANDVKVDPLLERSDEDYVHVAHMLLGQLNAKRLNPSHINDTQSFCKFAGRLPLDQSYSIYSWIIENAVKRYEKTDQAITILRPLFDGAARSARLVGRATTYSVKKAKQSKQYFSATIQADTLITLIKPGEKEIAIGILRDWFEEHVEEYLTIVDEYFGPQDLEILQLLKSIKPACKVQILTSKKHQLQEGVQIPWEDSYRDYWRRSISPDQDAPDTEIIIVGSVVSNKSPIHDRRWLTKKGGLRIGNSFGSLGVTQESEISRLSEDEASLFAVTANPYLTRVKRENDLGERLLYTAFTL